MRCQAQCWRIRAVTRSRRPRAACARPLPAPCLAHAEACWGVGTAAAEAPLCARGRAWAQERAGTSRGAHRHLCSLPRSRRTAARRTAPGSKKSGPSSTVFSSWALRQTPRPRAPAGPQPPPMSPRRRSGRMRRRHLALPASWPRQVPRLGLQTGLKAATSRRAPLHVAQVLSDHHDTDASGQT